MGGLLTINAVTNGYDGIQMVEVGRIIFAIRGSYSNFSNN